MSNSSIEIIGSNPTGADVAVDLIDGKAFQRIKVAIGGEGAADDVSLSNPMPIGDAGGSITVDGTVAISGAVQVADGGGSLTVDGTVTANLGALNGAASAANQAAVTGSKAPGAAAASSQLGGGVYASAGVSLSDGQQAALQLDSSGALKVMSTGGGAGTEYAEDAAAAANPTGPMMIAVRRDTLSASEVSADGDNVALKATNKGQLHVAAADALPVSDNGGSLTVDGTVSAAQSGTWNLNNISGTVSLPTGAATAANQTSIIGPKAPGAAAASAMLAGGVYNSTPPSLTDGQQAALQFDSAGNLKIASSGSGGTQYAEDSVAASGDQGTLALAVRRDAASSGVSADGDYAALSVDANGALRVTGGGGGQQYAEDAAHGSSDLGTMALGVRKDAAAALAGADGDYQPMIFDASGRLHVNGSGVTQPVSGTFWQATQPVSGTFWQATQPVSVAATVTTAGAVTAADGSALTNTLKGFAIGGLYNGVTADMARSAANALNSTGVGIQAVGLVAQVDETSPTAITENQFGNVRMSPGRFLYSAAIAGQDGVEGGAGAVSTKTQRIATASDDASFRRSAGTDKSATVTGSASTLIASNSSRLGFYVKNDTAVEVWINIGATATAAAGSGNIRLDPGGGYYETSSGFIPTAAVSAITTSGSAAVTAREF